MWCWEQILMHSENSRNIHEVRFLQKRVQEKPCAPEMVCVNAVLSHMHGLMQSAPSDTGQWAVWDTSHYEPEGDPLSRTQDPWLLVQWPPTTQSDTKGCLSCSDTYGNSEELNRMCQGMPKGTRGGTMGHSSHLTHQESHILWSVVTQECSVWASQDNSDFLRKTEDLHLVRTSRF